MAGKTVTICSKLPNGLILRNPLKPSLTVTIKGLNAAPEGANGARVIIPYATTEVDKDFWDAWFMVHNHETKPFGPLKSGAIWEAKTEEAAGKGARERERQKTGLEPVSKTDGGVKPDKD